MRLDVMKAGGDALPNRGFGERGSVLSVRACKFRNFEGFGLCGMGWDGGYKRVLVVGKLDLRLLGRIHS